MKKLNSLLLLVAAGFTMTACNSGTSSTSTTTTSGLGFYSDSQAKDPLTKVNLKSELNKFTKQRIYVKNNSSHTIVIPQAAFSKSIAGLSVIDNNCSTLASSQTCSFILEFTPQSVVHESLSYSLTGIGGISSSLKLDLITTQTVGKPVLVEYWCGFSGDFCGQSTGNDVNAAATHVIMAFANPNPSVPGAIIVDTANWPTALIAQWHAQGKKVLISVGGQNDNWTTIFENPANFAASVAQVISTYNLDGVDLDIENGSATPIQVADTINMLRNQVGPDALITIAPQNVGVYQASSVPAGSDSEGVGGWNFFVPVLENAVNSIDLVMQQDYNNWYGGDNSVYNASAASAGYIMNSYLNWVNSPLTIFPTSWGVTPIAGFSGVPSNKMIIGVLASLQAGISAYYATPQMIESAYATLQQSPYNQEVAGFMMWDSYWDSQNSYLISNTAAQLLNLN